MAAKTFKYLAFICMIAFTGIAYCVDYAFPVQSKKNTSPVSDASICIIENNADSVLHLWKSCPEPFITSCKIKIRKDKFNQLLLDYSALKACLLKAPDEKNKSNAPKLIIELPYPDGSLQPFIITKSSIMPAELTARYPQLNAYTGVNTRQAAESVRCECTGEGFRAMITTLQGEVLISNCSKKDSLIYLCYYKNDLIYPPKKKFEKKFSSANR